MERADALAWEGGEALSLKSAGKEASEGRHWLRQPRWCMRYEFERIHVVLMTVREELNARHECMSDEINETVRQR